MTKTSALEITELIGPHIERAIPDLAALRIRVFRDWPYLYDGSLDYEMNYLKTYTACPESLVVTVKDGARVVGASSALPLSAETVEFKRPFLERNLDVNRVFYLAESVLLPSYRGRGLGVRFFQAREAHARRLGGFNLAAFCAVERPQDHPARPASAAPLDAFWHRRGYVRQSELRAAFAWRDLGESQETEKPMIFWLKDLNAPVLENAAPENAAPEDAMLEKLERGITDRSGLA